MRWKRLGIGGVGTDVVGKGWDGDTYRDRKGLKSLGGAGGVDTCEVHCSQDI